MFRKRRAFLRTPENRNAENAHEISSKRVNSAQSGNIFFTLFGAVAIVGLLGTVVTSTIRGPITTMVEVQNRAKAESEMAIASRLVLLESVQAADDGDCDEDGFIEPLEYKVGGGNVPTGGGYLPDVVASSKVDPWGTDYGYCAWDPGPTTGAGGTCDANASAGLDRLSGESNSENDYTIVAIVSAGPDQIFNTTCTGGDPSSVAKGGDDLLVQFTYDTARGETGGLWTINEADPDVAEIEKNLNVTGGATFTGQLNLAASAQSMLLPDQNVMSGDCPGIDDVNLGIMRRNTTISGAHTLDVCGDTGWLPLSVGTTLWQSGDDEDIYYNPTGTPQVAIGKDVPTKTLDIDGTLGVSSLASFASAHLTGNLTVASTSSFGSVATFNNSIHAKNGISNPDDHVTIDDTLIVTGAIDARTNIYNSSGNLVLSDSTLQINGSIIGSAGTVNFSDSVLMQGAELDVRGNIVNDSGSVQVDDNLTVTQDLEVQGNIDAQGQIANSDGNVVLNDNFDVRGSIYHNGTNPVWVDDELMIINNKDLTVTGSADIDGDADIDGTMEADEYTWNGNDFTPETCSSGNFNRWTGTAWVCEDDTAGGGGGTGSDLGDLGDVTLTTPDPGACLVYDNVSGDWIDGDCIGGGIAIDDLTDAATDYDTDYNMFLGQGAGADIATDGQYNIFLGQGAGADVTVADNNIAIGYTALRHAVAVGNNIAIGYESMYWANSSGTESGGNNIAIGRKAMYGPFNAAWANTSTNNIAIGNDAILNIRNGTSNVAIGPSVMSDNNDGSGNIALGNNALDDNTDGDNNIAIGGGSLNWNQSRGHNIAIGNRAMFYGNNTTTVEDSHNIGIGFEALRGDFNVAYLNTGTHNVAIGGLTLHENQSGSYNVAIGHGAMNESMDSSRNTAVGYYAMYLADHSDVVRNGDNTALGYAALRGSSTASNNIGIRNTALGSHALHNVSSGSDNIAIGYLTGNTISTGSDNILIGENVQASANNANDELNIGDIFFGDIGNVSGDKKVGAFKYCDETLTTCFTAAAVNGAPSEIDDLTDALADYVTESNLILGRANATALTTGAAVNLYIGQGAGATSANSTADTDYNLAVGNDAMRSLRGGFQNTSIGHRSLLDINIGRANTALGHDALRANVAKSYNTAVGHSAMRYANSSTTESATSNTAVGSGALRGSTTAADNTGNDNTAIGASTMVNNTSGSSNTAVGNAALVSNSLGNGNVAIGKNSFYTGLALSNNVAVGAGSMAYADDTTTLTVTENTAVGYQSLRGSSTAADNTGIKNTAVGANSLVLNTSGENLVAVGHNSMFNNAVGTDNTALGKNSFYSATSLSKNVAVGYGAMYFADNTTTPADTYNTAVGYLALRGSTTASANTGTRNTAFGANAGRSITSGSDNILIGYNADMADPTADYYLNVGNTLYGTLTAGGDPKIGVAKYCDETFTDCFTASDLSGGVALSNIKDATGTNAIANANYAQVWNWDTLTTETALTLGSTSATSGTLLNVNSSATAMTGTMVDIALSGDDAGNTGTLVKSSVSGTSSEAVPLMVTNLGAGDSFRVNDETGDADTSPFVIDASGKVGIGAETPSVVLDIKSTDNEFIKIDRTAHADVNNTYSAGVSFSGGEDYFYIGRNAGVNGIVIRETDNVGIGTVTPDEKLHVRLGNIKADRDGPAIILEDTVCATDCEYTLRSTNGAFVIGADTSGSMLIVSDTETQSQQDIAAYGDIMTRGDNNSFILHDSIGGVGDSRYWFNNTNGLFTFSRDVDNDGTPSETILRSSGGLIGIGPSVGTVDTLLEVAGTVKIGNGGETCSGGETNYQGAIRYNATTDAIEFCKDNDTDDDSWETLADSGSTVSAINDLSDALADDSSDHTLIIGRPGATALTSNAQYNVFIGRSAGATSGNSTASTDANTAIGYGAMSSLTSGGNNTALGYLALQDNTTASANVAIGHQTLGANTAKQYNTAVGYQAMRYADSDTTPANTYNTAYGASALRGSTTPADNTGQLNTAIGGRALLENTSGPSNVAVGYEALRDNLTAGGNVAVGYQTLRTNKARLRNTAIGHQAMHYAVDSTTPFDADNTAVGYHAMLGSPTPANNTGIRNTALGSQALGGITSGSNNVAIGYTSGSSITEGSGNIMIGAVQPPAVDTDNYLNIGDTIYAEMATDYVGIGIADPSATLHVSGGDFLVQGTYSGTASVPVTGLGTRMFFDSETASFRAGYASGTHWDNGNIGDYSVAMGHSTRASGERSVAMGTASVASNFASIALGNNANSSGGSSVALGYGATSSGSASISAGNATDASGTSSIALGREVRAKGTEYTMAIGLADQSDTDTDRPTVTGSGSLGIFMDTADSYTLSDTDTLAVIGGQIQVDDDGSSAASKGCIAYDSSTSKLRYAHDCLAFTDFGSSSSLWTDNTESISRENFYILNSGETTDTAGLSANGGGADGKLLIFDPDKMALHGGEIWGGNDAFDANNIGVNSFAWGWNAQASGGSAIALGPSSNSTSTYTVAIGDQAQATGDRAIAIGGSASAQSSISIGGVASGNYSRAMGRYALAESIGTVALGYGVRAQGDYSVAISAGNNYPSGNVAPIVSGNNSMGIFLGVNDGITMSDTETLGVYGGKILIDDDGSSAASKGCIAYDSSTSKLQFSHNCIAFTDFSSGTDADWAIDAGNNYVYNTTDAIGINTATPTGGHLHIAGDADALPDNLLYLEDDRSSLMVFKAGVNSISAGIAFEDSSSANQFYLSTVGSTAQTLRLHSNQSVGRTFEFGNNIEWVDFTDDNIAVGIGESDAEAHLEVSASGSTGGNIFLLSSDDANDGDILTVQEDGDVGIGTTNPGTPLHIAADTLNLLRLDRSENASIDTTYDFIVSFDGEGEFMAISPSSVIGDDNPLSIRDTGFVGVGDQSPDTHFEISANGTTGSSVFMISSNDNNDGDIFIVQEDGDVGIGITDPQQALDVSGNIQHTGIIIDASDRRLKTDITPLDTDTVLDRLAQVKTYSFRMIDDPSGQVEFGVIAQELEPLFPELVVTADDEMQTKHVNYIGLITPLVEATNALRDENEELKAELAKKDERMAAIEARMASFEKDMDGLKIHTGYGLSKASIGMMMIMFGFGALGLFFIARRKQG